MSENINAARLLVVKQAIINNREKKNHVIDKRQQKLVGRTLGRKPGYLRTETNQPETPQKIHYTPQCSNTLPQYERALFASHKKKNNKITLQCSSHYIHLYKNYASFGF